MNYILIERKRYRFKSFFLPNNKISFQPYLCWKTRLERSRNKKRKKSFRVMMMHNFKNEIFMTKSDFKFCRIQNNINFHEKIRFKPNLT